jgi:hypothetical protein
MFRILSRHLHSILSSLSTIIDDPEEDGRKAKILSPVVDF